MIESAKIIKIKGYGAGFTVLGECPSDCEEGGRYDWRVKNKICDLDKEVWWYLEVSGDLGELDKVRIYIDSVHWEEKSMMVDLIEGFFPV